jgi:hypothetical protein
MKQATLYKTALATWQKDPARPVYIGSTDTAKLIRAALKEAFPKTKFSVRTDKYSGGSSIRIRWTDGPTQVLVDRIAKSFAGSGFDGMTDYKYSVGSWLMPNGMASTRSVEAHYGTEGETIEAAADGAIPVRFCADFVFTDRDYSPAALERAAMSYAAKFDDPLAAAIKRGALQIEDGCFGARFTNADDYSTESGEYAQTALYRVAQRRMMVTA